ncbi:protein OSCP1-like [Halichondria panicea]|uniref:protein OSCP1-like n=1 Tax=Halichondria panicea TaxID=6063 RepID=UPI00312B9720
MSLHTLPILFFNLGGEMLYILDQRLRAQNIPPKKSVKVMRDIVGQMFDARCVKELFRPQQAFSKKSLRTVFDRLAHASIMKLNTTAMDKLYDLMIMAVKYQILLCRRAEDVILVTLNHLDTIRALVGDSDNHSIMLNSACKTIGNHYGHFSSADLILLRNSLLTVFQDSHKRVSVFLKSNAQQINGRFFISMGGPVPSGFEVPGTIRYYGEDGAKVSEEDFASLALYEAAEEAGSWEIVGNRVITLGTNMYAADSVSESDKESRDEPHDEDTAPQAPKSDGDPVMRAELQLLEKLIMGIREPPSSEDSFRLQLFPDDNEQDRPSKKNKSSVTVVQISPSKKGKDELHKIMQDLTVQDTAQGPYDDDDLLDLMDSVS